MAALVSGPRPRGRCGRSKAVIAVGHSILTAAWHMLQTGELCNDLGGDYFTRQNPDRLTKRLVRRLEALGHSVTFSTPPGRRLTLISLTATVTGFAAPRGCSALA